MTYNEECDALQEMVNSISFGATSTYKLLKIIATILVAIYRRMGSFS